MKDQFPGEQATALRVFQLAEAYRRASELLEPQGKRRNPLSRAPYRLVTIQAVELYLNAWLLHKGHDAKKIRGMQHNLAARAEAAIADGLKLRKLTAQHLASMTGNREYLIIRYDPEKTATVSQINRLAATLNEVAKKVSLVIGA